MNAQQATDALGFRWKQEVRLMAKALAMHRWLNSPEENSRLRAALWALRNWDEYSDECRERREVRS